MPQGPRATGVGIKKSMSEKKQRGGYRANARRPTKSESGPRVNVTVRLSPENMKLRQEMGAGFYDWVNEEMDKVRGE